MWIIGSQREAVFLVPFSGRKAARWLEGDKKKAKNVDAL